MKPEIEINIPLIDGEVQKWGIARDDSCVVALRFIDGEWQPFKGGWIPSEVALHMSAVAATDIAMRQAYDAALHVMHPTPREPQEAQQSAGRTKPN